MRILGVLILSLLTSYIQADCPSKCNCSKNTVACISRNLESVPNLSRLTNNPVIIDLSGNEMQVVNYNDFSFDKSDQVQEIYLNNSDLVVIEDRAFEELEQLQELYLAGNLLSSLPEDLIQFNEYMILLDLSSNRFVEMPKIKSNSLEMLVIANSQVSKIADDALSELPNLRVLFLQQNNLKQAAPVIFQNLPQLFYVYTQFNPWQCNCETVKLFSFLNDNGFRDTTESVQCQTYDNFFMDVYDQNGLSKTFQEQCDAGRMLTIENQQKQQLVDFESLLKEIEDSTPEDDDEVSFTRADEDSRDSPFSSLDFFYACVLAVSVFISLLLGFALGICVTYKRMIMHMRNSESTSELISSKDYP